jgi:hypothetical protein
VRFVVGLLEDLFDGAAGDGHAKAGGDACDDGAVLGGQLQRLVMQHEAKPSVRPTRRR